MADFMLEIDNFQEKWNFQSKNVKMTDFILKIDNFQVKMDFFQVNNDNFGLKKAICR